MIPTKSLSLAAAVLLTACINLPDVEAPQNPPDGGAPDSGNPPSLTLTLVAPSGTTHTNGTVSVQLELQGDTPEQVELLADDQPLTTLVAPYTFNWDTTSVAEGTHRLAARARIGDKTFSSEVREVVVDRTPPQVESRTPTPGAQDVWVRQPIQATFSEPLKLSTLTSASVKLAVGGTEIASTSSLSTDGKTLTVTPATRLTVPNTAQLILTNAATDLAGNSLTVPSGTWSWDLPILFPMGGLSAVTGNTNAQLPFLQLDSQGKPYVVWREEVTSTKSNIYVYSWTGSDWAALGGPANPAPISTALSPQIIRLDSSNIPTVAWIEHDGATPGIHVKKWSGSDWASLGTPLNANPGTQHPPTSLALQLDSNGNPFIAWEQIDSSNLKPFLHVWRWTGKTWVDLGGPLPISQFEGDARPSLAIDSANNPIIAWANSSSDQAMDGVIVQRWTGSMWQSVGAPLNAIPSSPSRVFNPSIIIDASNNPIVSWSELGNSTSNIYVFRWADSAWEPLGSSFQAFTNENDIGASFLTKDGSGNLFIMRCAYPGHISVWGGVDWVPIGAPTSCTSSFAVDNSGTPFITYGTPASTSPSFVAIYRYNH